MKTRRAVSIALLAACALAPLDAADWKAPRTPWGDPDLQGTWTSEAELSVPFERNAQYGDRQWLTDAEFAQRLKQTEAAARHRQRRVLGRERRHRQCGRGRFGHVAAASLARAPRNVAPHVARRRSAGRPRSADDAGGAAAAGLGAAPRPGQRPVRRPGGDVVVGPLHHAGPAERDFPDGVQRQHAHRPGPWLRRHHLRDDSRHARHSRSARANTSRRRSGSSWATRAAAGMVTRSSST